MEDRNKSKAGDVTGDKESIVELTPDMELPEDADVKIIDLTDAIDGPADIPETPAAAQSTADTPAEEEVTESQSAGHVDDATSIEQEVDAAFDAVQAPNQQPAPEEISGASKEPDSTDEELLDRLSDIPRRVDEAMENAKTDEAAEEQIAAEAAPALPPAGDAGDITADDAGDTKDDDIIELTELVDPADLETDDFLMDDEDIIELTDIIDPAELLVGAAAEETDDDGIIELTDIVDPAELQAAFPEKGPPEPEQTGDLAAQEWALNADDAEAQTEDQVPLEDEPAEFNALPEDLSQDQDNAADAVSIGAIPPLEDDSRQEEGVIQLSEVIGRNSLEEDMPPIEQIQMGAEEELDNQTISLEAEAAGDAMGLDLEEEARMKDNTLTDQEIEAAVERILQTKYAETIERLIAKAVEKAVTREIESIKRAMLDGDDPIP